MEFRAYDDSIERNMESISSALPAWMMPSSTINLLHSFLGRDSCRALADTCVYINYHIRRRLGLPMRRIVGSIWHRYTKRTEAMDTYSYPGYIQPGEQPVLTPVLKRPCLYDDMTHIKKYRVCSVQPCSRCLYPIPFVVFF